MILLGVETSTLQGSVALGKMNEGKIEILFSKKWLRHRSHGELLTSSIEEALNLSEISIESVDGFCFSRGPGSFTGIRVGISAVKAFSYALEKPVYALSSLETLAHQVSPEKTPLLALINAHKNQCYASTFLATAKGWKTAIKPKALTLPALEKLIRKKFLCVGDGFDVFFPSMSKGLKSRLNRRIELKNYPEAETLVRYFLANHKKHKPLSWNSLEALYIRGSEAEEKLRSGLLKPLPEL